MFVDRCCSCYRQLKKQARFIDALDSTKKKGFNGKYYVHGTLVCILHPGGRLTWSRDVNAAKNMITVIRVSYAAGTYMRPAYLTKRGDPTDSDSDSDSE